MGKVTYMIKTSLDSIFRDTGYQNIKRNLYKRLDRNERNYPFDKKILSKLKKKITDYNLQAYPDQKLELIKKISKIENLSSNFIEIVPGSDGALKYLFEVFANKKKKINRVSFLYPTYGMVEVYSNIYKFKTLKIRKNYSKKVFIEKFNNSNLDFAYIANPNQPDGEMINEKDIIMLLKAFKRKKTFLIIDEAYVDFSGSASLSKLVKKNWNLIVIKSFSKSLGIAGLRVGYIISSPIFLRLFNSVRPIADTSSLSIVIATELLNNLNYKKKYISDISQARNYFIKECLKLKVKILDTKTNFLHMVFETNKRNKIYKKMKTKNFLVRKNTLSNGINKIQTIRVSLSDKKTMKYFFNSCKSILR